MALVALLLLQVLALGANGEVLGQDKAACVDSVEGACLAGDELPTEESAFIQDRASRSNSRRASGSHEHSKPVHGFPSADQLLATGFPHDNYLKMMGGLNDTFNELEKATELVTSTMEEMLGQMQSYSDMLLDTLSLAKTGAEHTRFILGDKAVEAAESLVDKLVELSSSLMSSANKTAGDAQREIEELWKELSAKKDEVMEEVTAAEQEIMKLDGKNGTLLQVGSRGPFGWLWRILGFGGEQQKSPCEKAQESLSAANSSLEGFQGYVTKFNNTVAGGTLDKLIDRFSESLKQFESSVKTAMQGVSSAVPSTVKSAVNEAVSMLGKVTEQMKKKLAPLEAKVAKFFKNTEAPLASVRTSLGKSEQRLTTKCA